MLFRSESLEGKTALVTGASRGIGAAIALSLAEAGAHVIAHYGSHSEGAKANLASIDPAQKTFISADFSQPGAARGLWREALAKVDKIDVLVNNAGINVETPFEGDDSTWDKGWQETFQVNLFESANIVREAVNHFLSREGGIIISLSSWSGQKGSALPTLPAYAASKAAVKALTQTVASSYVKKNI